MIIQSLKFSECFLKVVVFKIYLEKHHTLRAQNTIPSLKELEVNAKYMLKQCMVTTKVLN